MIQSDMNEKKLAPIMEFPFKLHIVPCIIAQQLVSKNVLCSFFIIKHVSCCPSFICILFVFIYQHQFVVMPYVTPCFILFHLFTTCELFLGFSMFVTSFLTSSFVVLHQFCFLFCINAFLKTILFFVFLQQCFFRSSRATYPFVMPF